MRLSPNGFIWVALAWLPGLQAATWFDLYNPVRADNFTIQVDLDSLHLSGRLPELLARIRFERRQPGEPNDFQTVIASVEVDCLNRQLFLRHASFYANTLHSDTRGMGPPSTERRPLAARQGKADLAGKRLRQSRRLSRALTAHRHRPAPAFIASCKWQIANSK